MRRRIIAAIVVDLVVEGPSLSDDAVKGVLRANVKVPATMSVGSTTLSVKQIGVGGVREAKLPEQVLADED